MSSLETTKSEGDWKKWLAVAREQRKTVENHEIQMCMEQHNENEKQHFITIEKPF